MRRKSVLIILIVLGISSLSSLGFYIRPVEGIIWIGAHITVDTTWTPVDTYRIINDTYVDPGVTLTILPGVHVQFADGFSLTVEGSLNATGTDANPIIFTSIRVSPAPGIWDTIRFNGSSSELFSFEHVKVEFAVNGITVKSLGFAKIARSEVVNCSESGIMIIGRSNVTIEENTIEKNKNGISTDLWPTMAWISEGITIASNTIRSNSQNGIYLFCDYSGAGGSGSIIRNINFSSNTISSNTQNGIYLQNYPGYGLGPGNSSICNLTFSFNNVSSNTENGIYLTSGGNSSIYDVVFSFNTVLSNKQNGIYLNTIGSVNSYTYPQIGIISNVTFSSNTVSSNSLNGICLLSSSCFAGDGGVRNVAFSSNTVSSNIQNGIYLGTTSYSSAYAFPESSDSIRDVTFSSNTVLSNLNGIYLSSTGANYWGTWEGSNSNSSIWNVVFSSNTVLLNVQAGIYLYIHSAAARNLGNIRNVVFSSNTISSNAQHGIQAIVSVASSSASDLTAFDNRVADNSYYGIYIEGVSSNISHNSICYNLYGVFYASMGNLANHNDIYFNTYGMNVTGGATVDARYVYWGDSTGPYNPAVYPEGKGNPVNGNGVNLEFIPFLSSPQGSINQRPVAVLTVDKNIVGKTEPVAFNATASFDDGQIDYYFFDFGDGTNSGWTTLPIVMHEYSIQKTYMATLIVMDDFGVTSNNTQQAVVQVIVIPEFPSFLVLPLFMMATLLAVIFHKRKSDPE